MQNIFEYQNNLIIPFSKEKKKKNNCAVNEFLCVLLKKQEMCATPIFNCDLWYRLFFVNLYHHL